MAQNTHDKNVYNFTWVHRPLYTEAVPGLVGLVSIEMDFRSIGVGQIKQCGDYRDS